VITAADGNWFHIANATVERAAEVGPYAFTIFCALARFTNQARECYPSAATLSAMTGMTRRSVFNAIDKLEAAGWVTVQREKAAGCNARNVYRLTTQEPSEPDAPVTTKVVNETTKVVNEIHQGGELNSPEVVNETTREQEPRNKTQGRKGTLTLSKLIEEWNRIPEAVHCRAATESRKKAFKARATKPSWGQDVPKALERVGKSSFCCGDNDRGWRADIDWFLRPDTVTKILEGKYDGRNGNGKPRPDEEPRVLPREECGSYSGQGGVR